MSPKTASETKVLTRTAWSRDAQPNTSGVTYNRRSYYYDREFSDSIVRPTDGFDLSGRSTATEYQEAVYDLNEEYNNDTSSHPVVAQSLFQSAGRHSRRRGVRARPLESSNWRCDDTQFQKDRVLQSTGDDDHDDDEVHELQDGAPPNMAQSRASSATDPMDPEPGLTIWGFGMDTIAQGVLVGLQLGMRLAEMYQYIRDSGGGGGDGEEEGADDDFFVDLDPYHLEAGPPRRLRPTPRWTPPARKSTAQRALVAAASTTMVASAPDESQEGTGCQSSNATVTKSLTAPLPASKRVCYYLVATVVFGVLASFGFALWWAHSQGDVSAAFTIGGYVIAVDALVVAVVGVVHRPGCRCWKS